MSEKDVTAPDGRIWAMPFDPSVPHDDLPALPPPVNIETRAVLKQCLAAARAVAELKGAGGLIPDQAILINAIPLQEAKLTLERCWATWPPRPLASTPTECGAPMSSSATMR